MTRWRFRHACSLLSTALFTWVVVGAAASILPATARAGIISTTGQIEIVSPPSDVRDDQFESNEKIRGFLERGSFVLPSNVTVDAVTPGLYDQTSDLPSPKPVVPSGTLVDVWLFHSDPVSGTRIYDAIVEFDVPILGVMVLRVTLRATDGTLGHPGTQYPTGSFTGLELGPNNDLIEIVNPFKIRFHFETSTVVDQTRVLTGVIPEPASILLMGVGLVTLHLGRRKWR
ncbi:MAG: hypothetical protein C4296_05060 [Gemmataceae bacterium]